MPKNLSELSKEAFHNSFIHGFYGDEKNKNDVQASINVGEKIALMHTELSEAFEEFRNGRTPTEVYCNAPGFTQTEDALNAGMKPEGIPIELADCLIRIFDFCGAFGIDIDTAVEMKMKYNASRPYRHGGKKA